MGIPPALQSVALALLELPVALGVFRTALLVAYRGGCQLTPCHDLQVPGVLVYALPVAAAVAIAYWIVAFRKATQWRKRLTIDGVALLVAVAGYVVAPR